MGIDQPLGVAADPALALIGERAAKVQRRTAGATLRAAARSRRGRFGLVLATPVVLLAFLGPLFAPQSPSEFVTAQFAPRSPSALLGGDELGRDVLSRLMFGGWRLLLMATAATMLGVAVGTAIGIAAAYFGRWPDGVLMRAVDVVLAFPQLVFALVLVSVIGPKIWLIVVAIGVSHVPQVARVIRAATLDIAERDFVKATQLLGVSSGKVATTEILPNLVTPLMVEIGLRLTFSIILMAGLSFVGLGVQPPAADWGVMINENRLGLGSNPWGVIAPAIVIAILTVGLNTFTDAVSRVALGVDPSRPVARGKRLLRRGAAR